MPELMISATQKVSFKLPSGWRVLSHFTPKKIPVPDLYRLMEDRIGNPIHSKKLEERIASTDRVVILIDDYTRATPHEDVLTFLTERLGDIGVPKHKIHIIVACATHSHLEGQALESTYGEKFVKEFQFSQHHATADDLVEFTQLSDGTPVKINPFVAQSDFCIGVGILEPHPFNGYGGGGKIIFPGVVDYDSIVRHHASTYIQGCGPGNTSGNNYFYQEIKRVAQRSPLSFIINFLCNERKEAIDIVAGDPIPAHEQGVEIVKRHYGVQVEEEADVTITSSYPYDVVTQTFKPFSTAYLSTKRGGEIILAAQVKRGPELQIVDVFEEVFSKYETALDMLNDFNNHKLPIPGAPIDMNIAFPYVFDFKNKMTLTYVTNDMHQSEIEKLGFNYSPSLQQAINKSYHKNPNATVNIYSMGGMVIPLNNKCLLG